MDIAPLQKWLALPPGPWPPDDRALLGLPDGPVDAAVAESNALTRMEHLRPHQLVHPELVTEGMNRLAQALIALTSGTPEPPPAPVSLAPQPSQVPAAPQVLEAEVVDAIVVTAPPPRRSVPIPTRAPLAPVVLVGEPEPVIVLDEAAPVGTALDPADRRKAYRELVFLRRLRRLWDRLGPLAGSVSEPLRAPEAVFITLTTGRELRELLAVLPAAGTLLRSDGRLVSAVFTQPQVTTVFRELTPTQRAAVAADWVAGKTTLETGYVALRASLRNSRARRKMGLFGSRVAKFFRSNPEWVLGLLTAFLVLVGLVRAMLRAAPASGG